MTETFVPGDDYANKWWSTLAPLPTDSPMYRASYIDPLPRLPRAPKPRRAMLAFAALITFVPAPMMPALLIIPIVAPLLALTWIVARGLWTGEIVLAW